VEVIETMIGKGYKVRIHDRNVSLARLIGANKDYIEKEIPHISELLSPSAEELISQSDILVIANKDKTYLEPLKNAGDHKVVVDLVRLFGPEDRPAGEYYGICW
jgi:GDP-mannose 6-dehydrogenase